MQERPSTEPVVPKKPFWVRMLKGLVVSQAVAMAFIVAGLVLLDARIGVDVQRLIGEPACMPSLVYLWHKSEGIPQAKTGDYVVALMPDSGMKVGARTGDRIVKKVMAVTGDRVRIAGTELWINGVHTDRLWLAKSLPDRAPGDFDRDEVLGEGELFLMGTTKESFDSRYWGTVHREAIIGSAIPLF